MNSDQIMGLVRTLLPAGLAYVVGRGWIPAGSASDVGAAVAAAAAALFSIKAHTDSSKLAAVEALPDVKKIIVTPPSQASNEAVKDAAIDAGRPKVAAAI